VNCEDARRQIGAEPGVTSGELAEHLNDCPACAEFQLEMIVLDAHIRRALEELPPIARPRGRLAPPRMWALAASVVVAVVAILSVWALRTETSLAHEVVAHVVAEPQSWVATDAVSEGSLRDVLLKSGLVLDATPYSVVYARSCWFRGHYVPHLVVRTAHSLATVLVLRNETVTKRESFSEEGLSGVIVPSAHGSIAVLAADGAQLDTVAQQMRLAVRSQNAAR
jgi:Protein of unknown function (DUF3379)